MMQPNAFYRHYKGKPYRTLGIAHHSETMEELVLYEALYPNSKGPLWVRPRSMFEGKLDDGVTERFKLDAQANRQHPVQRQLDAYNSRNLEEFLDCYSDDVIVTNGQTNDVLSLGKAAMREQYKKMFANSPNLHCTVVKRMELGDTVIDQEVINGHPRGNNVQAIAIYDLKANKIVRVRFIS